MVAAAAPKPFGCAAGVPNAGFPNPAGDEVDVAAAGAPNPVLPKADVEVVVAAEGAVAVAPNALVAVFPPYFFSKDAKSCASFPLYFARTASTFDSLDGLCFW